MDLAAGSATQRTDPSAPPPWQLTDLISVETLQSIQDTFARAFGLPTVIVDTTGADATTITHRVTFCEDLTRTSEVAGPRCTDCDLCGMRKASDTSGPAIFKCWNGLYDCAIPIAPKGHVLGYFLCGQILTEQPKSEHYAEVAAEIGVDPDEYVGALADVSVVPYEQYEASVQSMHVLAGMIAEQAAASIDSLKMLEDARRAKAETAQLVEELDTILEALRDIGSQPDYQATLASVADNLARLIPWDSCVIYLTDDEGEELVPVVIRDPSAEKIAAYRPRMGSGILGTTALGGPGRRILDVTQDPDFEPIPGVPLEPESALVMPMVYKGTVSGVIMLSRFERRTFTDHELRVLDVFSSQASVSVQVSKLASESAQRLREERTFGRLRLAIAPRTKVESILAVAGQAGMEVLAADAAILCATGTTRSPTTARIGLDEDAADSLLRELAPVVERACEEGDPEVVPYGAGSALVIPLAAGHPGAFGVFIRREGSHWDRRVVGELRAQASLGIEKAGMQERERRLLLQYQRLSELGTELVTAHDATEVRGHLLARTPEILGADACFIALLDQGPDAIAVELRQRSHSEECTLQLQGGARLATLRLRDEAAPDRSVFDSWSASVFAAIGPDAELTTWLAEPLPVPGGAIGGLFVGWHAPDTEPSPEQSRILGVLASSGGSALGRFAASMATDSTLRDRLLELEALTGLAQRISGLTSETEIADDLLARAPPSREARRRGLRRLGRRTCGSIARPAWATRQLADLTQFLEGLGEWSASSRVRLPGRRLRGRGDSHARGWRARAVPGRPRATRRGRPARPGHGDARALRVRGARERAPARAPARGHRAPRAAAGRDRRPVPQARACPFDARDARPRGPGGQKPRLGRAPAGQVSGRRAPRARAAARPAGELARRTRRSTGDRRCANASSRAPSSRKSTARACSPHPRSWTATRSPGSSLAAAPRRGRWSWPPSSTARCSWRSSCCGSARRSRSRHVCAAG